MAPLHVAVASGWQPSLPDCTVFAQHHTVGGQTRLPAGSLILPQDTSGFASGYQPSQTLIDVGRLEITAYDCPRRMTANGVTARLHATLEAAGYTRRFACRGRQCGPPPGWQRLLGLHAAPSRRAFNYSLMSRQYAKGRAYVAVYAANLDQRPRVVVYELQADYDLPAKLEFDRGQVRASSVVDDAPLVTVRFATGSAQLAGKQKLRDAVAHAAEVKAAAKAKAKAKAKANAGAKSEDSAETGEAPPESKAESKAESGPDWVVVGHADPRGTNATNGPLSWRRARTVADVLVDLGVPPAALRVYAVGAQVSSSGDWERGAAAAAERRVDVFWRAPPPEDDEEESGENAAHQNSAQNEQSGKQAEEQE
ncbi:OmpA family protein [Salinisphaera sp.]|uniref:OmpA family protein n=1 Tax=Salinisphaera sp. TaxID=1914330 RepID=UPI002D774A5E|nr:OmpA family protein [Salinisphaera sp.]HET7313107.1 OmpA family protein [Salinisphaera sp.]